MKILLAQHNYHIGNFTSNSKKIISSIQKAKKEGLDLVVFSELSVCGYPPLDLLEHESFIEGCQKALRNIIDSTIGIAAIVGIPTLNDLPKGKNLFNSAVFIENGSIKKIIHKTLLPTYDIFDEYRYFESGKSFELIEFKGEKIALTICEDLWYDQPMLTGFSRSKLYTVSPMQELANLNPDLVINISASPFAYRQEEVKREVLVGNSRKYKIPCVYVNQIGAHTELIFDGGSMVLNNQGGVVRKMKSFEEDHYVVDTAKINQMAVEDDMQVIRDYVPRIHDAIILGIKDYFQKMNFKGAVLGLSGGIDSAVVASLAVKALGNENVRGVLMPSKYSSDHSVVDAEDLAKNLNIKYNIIPIQNAVDSFDHGLEEAFRGLPSDVTEENVQARTRGVILMAMSNKLGYILLNTSNKSEAAVGYTTLYGDMNGGLSVLGDVYKSDVYKLAKHINKLEEIIPINTIIKPPSAELRPDQKDSDTLPEYDILDEILFRYIELKEPEDKILAKGFEKKVVSWVLQQVNRNEYKRFQSPPILRVSSKAFGLGRRMPLVASFEAV